MRFAPLVLAHFGTASLPLPSLSQVSPPLAALVASSKYLIQAYLIQEAAKRTEAHLWCDSVRAADTAAEGGSERDSSGTTVAAQSAAKVMQRIARPREAGARQKKLRLQRTYLNIGGH
jgi:hypothetical protein